MRVCPKCGASASGHADFCAYCGASLATRPAVSTDELARAFLEGLEQELLAAGGHLVVPGVLTSVVLPFGVYFGLRWAGAGVIASVTAAVLSGIAAFVAYGMQLEREQDRLFERTLRGRVEGFLREHQIEKGHLQVIARRVMDKDAKVIRGLSRL